MIQFNVVKIIRRGGDIELEDTGHFFMYQDNAWDKAEWFANLNYWSEYTVIPVAVNQGTPKLISDPGFGTV